MINVPAADDPLDGGSVGESIAINNVTNYPMDTNNSLNSAER